MLIISIIHLILLLQKFFILFSWNCFIFWFKTLGCILNIIIINFISLLWWRCGDLRIGYKLVRDLLILLWPIMHWLIYNLIRWFLKNWWLPHDWNTLRGWLEINRAIWSLHKYLWARRMRNCWNMLARS